MANAYSVDQMDADTKMYILCNSVGMKVNRQNQSKVIEVRQMVTVCGVAHCRDLVKCWKCSLFWSGRWFHEYSYIKYHRIVHLRFGHCKCDVSIYIVLYVILFVWFSLLSISPHRRGRRQCCLALELCVGAWGALLSDSQSYTAYVSWRTRLPSPSTVFSAQLIVLFLVLTVTAPSARFFPGPPCRQPSLPADRQGSALVSILLARIAL